MSTPSNGTDDSAREPPSDTPVHPTKVTGISGITFADRAVALFAAHLLADRPPLDDALGAPTRLQLEARREDWYLDDLVVHLSGESGHVRCGWSIKSNDQLRSGRAPRDFVLACWRQLLLGSFDEGRDLLGLMMAPHSGDTFDELHKLIGDASVRPPAEFERNLAKDGLYSKAGRKLAESFRCPEELAPPPGTDTSPGRVLRCLQVRQLDFQRTPSEDLKTGIRLCAEALVPEQEGDRQALWDRLVVIFHDVRPKGGSLDRKDLERLVGPRFRFRRPARRRLRVAAITVSACLTLGGVALAWVLARPTDRPIRAPDIAVRAPDDWKEVKVAPPAVLDLTRSRVIEPPRPRDASIVIGRSRAEGPALLPPAILRRNAGALMRADVVALNGMESLRYVRLRTASPGKIVSVFVIPWAISERQSQTGVAMIACYSGVKPDVAFDRDCEDIAATATLRGRDALPVGPDPSYLSAVNAALNRVNREWASLQEDLDTSTTGAGRVLAATSLQSVFDRAVDSLGSARVSPRDAIAHRRLLRALQRLALAYSQAAQAAAPLQRSAFNRAVRETRLGEDALQTARRALGALGYPLA